MEKLDKLFLNIKYEIKKAFKEMGVNVNADDIIENPAKKKVYSLNLSLKELKRLKKIDWEPMAYQRGFVATDKFIEGIGMTIIGGPGYEHIEIPPIHLRLFKKERQQITNKNLELENIIAECLDGLQRVLSAIDRLFDNKFKFSKGTIIQGLKGEDINLFDKNFTDIERDHPELFKERFENNAITTKLYYNISDKEARQLFAEILNNTNKITAHIIRAASKHDIADVVRFLVRLNDASKYFDGKKEFLYNHYNLKRLEMFSGIVQPNKTKIFDFVKFDNKSLDHEETVAKFFSYFRNQKTNSATLDKLYANPKFETDIPGFEEFKKSIEEFDSLITISRKGKEKLSKWQLIKIYTLFENLRTNGISVKSKPKFMKEILILWYELTKKKVKGMQKNQFALDSSKDSSDAIQRHLSALLKEVLRDQDRFGLVRKDKRRKFSKDDMEQRLRLQDYKCVNCDEDLLIEDMVGGHGTMHAYGGNTDIENCKAIHNECNKTDHFLKSA
jgi:hypothetical protein|tara:strand:+ start:447 stop:1952 length:1506 start_codon:yes stop_codon:yes gene_type:complete